MPVARIGSFLEFRNFGITPSLGLESAQLSQCVAEVQRRGWRGVFGNPVFGFHEDNLDVRQELPNLLQVWFWDVKIKNVEGIYALNKLKYFGVHDVRSPIDFSKLPNLETMVWTHKTKDRGVESLANLRTLDVWHYKPRSKSFEDLQIPSGVTSLSLNWANPATLSGLRRLPSLRFLEIARCRNLTSLDGLAEIAPSLEKLIAHTSGKLTSYIEVKNIPSLKLAVIHGNKIVG
jgi:hypothetical protein